MPSQFPAALRHGPIRQVFPDVFVVRGTFRFMPLFEITRNMTIVRVGEELVLVNSVRLSPEGEAELEKLGTPKHLLRIGEFHGMDDAWYVNRYGVSLWWPKGAAPRPPATPSQELKAGVQLPIPDAELFLWEHGEKPECAVLLKREGGILITCDSVQNWSTFDGCSFLGKVMMKRFGFGPPAQIGPFWKKLLEGKTPGALKPDFERLLQLEWRHVLSGHGEPLLGTARDLLRQQVRQTFG
jgi:hypothetical protein